MDRPAFALLWILVFTIPWTNMLTIGSSGSIARFLGVVTFGVSAVTVMGTRRIRPLKGVHIVMMVFVWWASLTFYWSLAPDRTLQQCGTYVQLVAMVWVIWQFTSTVYRTRCLMQAFVLGAFVAIAATFGDRIAAGQALGVRFTAPGFNPNDVGLMLALGIPVAWHLSTISRGPGAWVNRSYLPLAMIAILLTASRTGFAVAVVALLIIPWTVGTLSARARFVTTLTIAVVIFGTYSLVPSTSWERIAATPDAVVAGDLSHRMEIWQAGLTIASEHAVVGVGTGAFAVALEPIHGSALVAHNAYLSVLAENGVVGFALFCTMLLWLFVLVLRMPYAERRVWLMVLVAWMVGVFFLTWEYRHSTWLLWGLLVASAHPVDHPVRRPVACGEGQDARERTVRRLPGKDRIGYVV